MKGIILAGGTGSRLWPNTKSVSKQLIPVYDKPLVYYPLSTLMLAGIREILIITTPLDQPSFENLLGDGSQIGLKISYDVQEKPDGLAQAFIIGEDFIGSEPVALILGDNIFHGAGLGTNLAKCTNPEGAKIFGYFVNDPERYGVASIGINGKVVSIVEKPKNSVSNLAIPGLYFLDNSASKIAKSITKSARGELEITSVLESYLKIGKLEMDILPRGTAWLDCGTVDSMNDASNYIRVVEERQGLKIGCIEEIAWRQGWISNSELSLLGKNLEKNEYGKYLLRLVANS